MEDLGEKERKRGKGGFFKRPVNPCQAGKILEVEKGKERYRSDRDVRCETEIMAQFDGIPQELLGGEG